MIDTSEFLAALDSNHLLLTANRRLATYVKDQYNQIQQSKGLKIWPTLQAMPLSAWIEDLWKKHTKDSKRVLTDAQELTLWQEVISSDERWFNLTSTASLAKQAWNLLHQWMLSADKLRAYDYLDVQAFINWQTQFSDLCKQAHAITRSELLVQVCGLLHHATPLPPVIYFVGFDELTPAAKLLQQTLERTSQVQSIMLGSKNVSSVSRSAFEDVEQQYREMVRWSYRCLKQHPEATVGCIIPNLSAVRQKLSDLFEEVFIAESYQSNFSNTPVNISAANSLSDYPLIATGIGILSLNQHQIPVDEFSHLLRSPYLGDALVELSQRMKLDVRLREMGEAHVAVKATFHNRSSEAIRVGHYSTCPRLVRRLTNFFSYQISHEKQTLEQWANHFATQLQAMGWPGDRTLTSLEFQLIERFKKLLDEYVTIHILKTDFTFNEALQILKDLITSTLFQPKTTQQPIQVLGMLEASGIVFDYLWVADLDNEKWPSPAAPNPFIPIAIQRQYAMPHASADKELQYSLTLTKRFTYSAKEVVFSYAKNEGDRTLAPSSLITSFPEITLVSEYQSIETQLFHSKQDERIDDDLAPAIQGDNVSGGSWILKSQALCPFQAFAQFRLHARPLEDNQIGLAFHERGSIVHEILACFWQEIRTHESLCALDDTALRCLIAKFIDQTLASMQNKKPVTLNNRLLQIEKKRLERIILAWLTHEKLRSPFQVISCEQKQAAKIGPLNIHIQIDRIDELPDGSQLIIDYKTGACSVQNWFGERPNEPQLPIYALLSKETTKGILFAQVRAGDIGFKGVNVSPSSVPGATSLENLRIENFTSWNELIDYWEKIIEQLAADFYQGVAAVDPKDAAACQYCGLHELCRIKR